MSHTLHKPVRSEYLKSVMGCAVVVGAKDVDQPRAVVGNSDRIVGVER